MWSAVWMIVIMCCESGVAGLLEDPCKTGSDPWAVRLLFPSQQARISDGGPAETIPSDLRSYYTRCGTVPLEQMFVDDTNGGKQTHYSFPRSSIDYMIGHATKWRSALRSNSAGRNRNKDSLSLKDTWLFMALEKHSVNGKSVLIVGSLEPWHESVCLAFGAASVTTLEYNKLSYEHPLMTQLTVSEHLPELMARSDHELFDVIFSISSFDHDGLGRYGDPLDPDADLRAMDTMRRLVKRDGLLFVTVPIGPDLLVWNLHRIYGPKRLPLFIAGWHKLDVIGWSEQRLTDSSANFRKTYEPLFVLQRRDAVDAARQDAASTTHQGSSTARQDAATTAHQEAASTADQVPEGLPRQEL